MKAKVFAHFYQSAVQAPVAAFICGTFLLISIEAHVVRKLIYKICDVLAHFSKTG
jgi:hypothetical protein